MTGDGRDNPFWSALDTLHRDIALRAGDVARYPPAYAPFLGIADAEADVVGAFDALALGLADVVVRAEAVEQLRIDIIDAARSAHAREHIVRLMSAGVTVAFDSHWSWTNVAQYDNVSEALGVNSRLHWTPRAGRNAYLVVNHGRQGMGQGPDATSWLVALKYNHDLRF